MALSHSLTRQLVALSILACCSASATAEDYVLRVSMAAAEYAKGAEEGDRPVSFRVSSIDIRMTPGKRLHVKRSHPKVKLFVELAGRFKQTTHGRFRFHGKATIKWTSPDGQSSFGSKGGLGWNLKAGTAGSGQLSASHVPQMSIRCICYAFDRWPQSEMESRKREKRIKQDYRRLIDERFNETVAR